MAGKKPSNRKEYFRIHNKMYHQKFKKKILKRKRDYYKKNKERIIAYRKKNYKKFKMFAKKLREKNIKSWRGYIPLKTNCKICGKTLYFNKRKPKTAIHFDHRIENIPIKMNPTHWLISRYKTKLNQEIWEQCDFGILCRRCNAHLPTKDRKDYLLRVIKYVFGERSKIINGK